MAGCLRRKVSDLFQKISDGQPKKRKFQKHSVISTLRPPCQMRSSVGSQIKSDLVQQLVRSDASDKEEEPLPGLKYGSFSGIESPAQALEQE